MWPGIARKGVCATWGVQWTGEMLVNDDFSLQEFLPPSLVPSWSARALQPEVLLTLSNLTCRQPVDDVCTRDHAHLDLKPVSIEWNTITSHG